MSNRAWPGREDRMVDRTEEKGECECGGHGRYWLDGIPHRCPCIPVEPEELQPPDGCPTRGLDGVIGACDGDQCRLDCRYDPSLPGAAQMDGSRPEPAGYPDYAKNKFHAKPAKTREKTSTKKDSREGP